MPTALDLVHNTMEKKPGEFQTNFAGLVTDKIADIIAGKRIELAQSVFGGVNPKDDDEVDPPVTPEDDDDDDNEDDDNTDVEDNEDGEEEAD